MDSRYSGLVDYKYQIPKLHRGKPTGEFHPIQTKTVYTSAISTKRVAEMSTRAAEESNKFFAANPAVTRHSVNIDGYPFQVYKHPDFPISQAAHLKIPNRVK